MLFGLELEYEGITYTPKLNSFVIKEDLSLRDYKYSKGKSFELTFNEGKSYKDSLAAVQELEDFFKKNPKISPSIRCGLHIHFSDKFLHTFSKEVLKSAYVIEPILFYYLKYNRDKNINCTPLSFLLPFTGFSLDNILTKISHESNGKYYSLNVGSFKKFATFEFRLFPSTTNIVRIKKYLSLVKNFYTYKEILYKTDITAILNFLELKIALPISVKKEVLARILTVKEFK